MTVRDFFNKFHWTTSIDSVLCVNEKTDERTELSITQVLNVWWNADNPIYEKSVSFFGVEDKILFVYYAD